MQAHIRHVDNPVETPNLIKKQRDVMVSAPHGHLDRNLGIEVVELLGLLPEQEDFEARILAKTRNLTEQLGNFLLLRQLGLSLVKCGLHCPTLGFDMLAIGQYLAQLCPFCLKFLNGVLYLGNFLGAGQIEPEHVGGDDERSHAPVYETALCCRQVENEINHTTVCP